MRCKQQRIFTQRPFRQAVPANIVGFKVVPLDHPGGMFDLDGMMVKVAQEIESLGFGPDTNNLMSRRLAGC